MAAQHSELGRSNTRPVKETVIFVHHFQGIPKMTVILTSPIRPFHGRCLFFWLGSY